jgi:hypothetical protein
MNGKTKRQINAPAKATTPNNLSGIERKIA